MNTTKIAVIRDQEEKVIPIEDLVLGDVIVLQTGDQIPADGQVISGTLRVNEALLTGEADEIEKRRWLNPHVWKFCSSGQSICTS